MVNPLDPYLSQEDGDADEVNHRIDEMEEAIKHYLTDEELKRLWDASRSYRTKERLITLPVLQEVTGYTVSHLSSIRNGRVPTPDLFIRLLRLLHKEVTDDPKRARDYIMASIRKEEREEEEAPI